MEETHLNIKNIHYLQIKDRRKIFQANVLKKKAGMIILIANRIDFKSKLIRRNQKGHYIPVVLGFSVVVKRHHDLGNTYKENI